MIICPVRRLSNLQLCWNFLVAPRNIASFGRSSTVLVGFASSSVSAYVSNSTLQFFMYSRLRFIIIFLGEYIWWILMSGGKEFSHNTTKRIIPIMICTGDLFNVRVIQISHVHYFITLICLSIYGTCYADAVVFRFY